MFLSLHADCWLKSSCSFIQMYFRVRVIIRIEWLTILHFSTTQRFRHGLGYKCCRFLARKQPSTDCHTGGEQIINCIFNCRFFLSNFKYCLHVQQKQSDLFTSHQSPLFPHWPKSSPIFSCDLAFCFILNSWKKSWSLKAKIMSWTWPKVGQICRSRCWSSVEPAVLATLHYITSQSFDLVFM